MSIRSVSSARRVRIQRSAVALAFGQRAGVLTAVIPASASTASKASVNCPARSRIRTLNEAARSPRSIRQKLEDRLAIEQTRLHPLPADPHTSALGETRIVGDDQTVSFGAVRYSVPRQFVREQVWCRVVSEEIAFYARPAQGSGIREIARHRLGTPGNPQINEEHYDGHPLGRSILEPAIRPRGAEEEAFTALGEGSRRWLREAAACGTPRIRREMRQAVELAHIVGAEKVDHALGLATIAGRFDEGDLASILDHLHTGGLLSQVIRADETHSVQPGTSSWSALSR